MINNQNYYEVIAKCGHVGRGYYYEGHFFVYGESKRDAAQKVKTFPRVKKDHNDVILNVYRITEEELVEGKNKQASNPYFSCTSKYQQDAYWEEIKDGIKPETENQLSYRKNKNKYYKDEDKIKGKGFIRNRYKYLKLNPKYTKYDYAYAA